MTLTVVTGPPCSGKSRYVDEHRTPADLVLDVDRLAVALGHPGDRIDWLVWHAAREAARVARRAVTDAVAAGQFHAHAWLVETSPHPTSLHIWARQGVNVIRLNPGRDECRARAERDGRPDSTFDEIDRWYAERGASIGGARVTVLARSIGRALAVSAEKSSATHRTPDTSPPFSPRHRPENSEQSAGGLGPRG